MIYWRAMDITKASLKTALGVATDAELAQFFDTSKQAVSQWGEDDAPLPAGRQWEVRARLPHLFPTPEDVRAA
jgi:phage terminase Nu1 subunit (DNA packaging protein)